MAPGSTRGGVTCRIGPQKQTADGGTIARSIPTGKGEKVVANTVRSHAVRSLKRPPALPAMEAARQPPPGARPSRGKGSVDDGVEDDVVVYGPGRLLVSPLPSGSQSPG